MQLVYKTHNLNINSNIIDEADCRLQIAERGVASDQAGVREVKRTDCNGVVSTEARNAIHKV